MKQGRVARALAALAAVVALAACDRLAGNASPFKGVDVTGSDMKSEIALTDADGKARSIADFRGKVVLVIFGYTQCPDVCPTSLADAAKALRQLGGAASRVQVLFVSVDPGRDKPALLREYVAAFDPSFVALTGPAEAIARVTTDFKVYAAVHESATPAEYTVEHSGQMFVLDGQGRTRLVLMPGMPSADIASDLRVLLNNE